MIPDGTRSLSMFTYEVYQGKHNVTKRAFMWFTEQLQITGTTEQAKEHFDNVLVVNDQLMEDIKEMLEKDEEEKAI